MTAYTVNKHVWLDQIARLELTGRELRILIAIKSVHRDEVAEVSVADIMMRTNLPRRTVQRQLDAVSSHGLVAIERSRGGPRKHRVILLDPALARVERSASDRENCATQGGAVEDTEIGAVEEGNCATLDGAVTAPPYARARNSTLTLAEGGPPAGPLPTDASRSTILDSSFKDETVDAAPVGPLMGPGADVPIDGSGNEAEAAPEQADAMGDAVIAELDPSDAADGIDERIQALAAALSDLRDPDTGEYPEGRPLVLGIFLDRGFYFSEDDPISVETISEAEAALASWMAGTWVEPDDDEDDEDDEDERAINIDRDACCGEGEYDGGVERDIVERMASQQSRAIAPLADRIVDQEQRADFIDRMASALLLLDRNERWQVCKRRQASLVTELKETLPRFLAESFAGDLMDEIKTEVWRRERKVEFGAMGVDLVTGTAIDGAQHV